MESEKQTKNEKQTKGEKRMEDEKQAARKRRDKRYNDYVKQVTPKHNCLLNMLKAFVSGGFICVIGQMFSDWYGSMGLMKDEVSGYTTLSLILISVILYLIESLQRLELILRPIRSLRLISLTRYCMSTELLV